MNWFVEVFSAAVFVLATFFGENMHDYHLIDAFIAVVQSFIAAVQSVLV